MHEPASSTKAGAGLGGKAGAGVCFHAVEGVLELSKAAFILSTTVAGCSIDFPVGCKEKRQRTLQVGLAPLCWATPESGCSAR